MIIGDEILADITTKNFAFLWQDYLSRCWYTWDIIEVSNRLIYCRIKYVIKIASICYSTVINESRKQKKVFGIEFWEESQIINLKLRLIYKILMHVSILLDKEVTGKVSIKLGDNKIMIRCGSVRFFIRIVEFHNEHCWRVWYIYFLVRSF